jgi:hypothetical protein
VSRLVNDIRTRLYIDSDWRDISTHVRQADKVRIRRGYGAEDDTAPPSTCKLTLDNGPLKGNGDYNPRNPLGQWYGYLGQSTPLELACRVAKDTMSVTASNGWGTTEAHANGAFGALPWTVFSTTSNYAKAAGKATHALSAAGDVRVSYLATVSMRDLDFAVTFNLPTNNVTGSSVGAGIGVANIVLRGQGALSDYLMLRLVAQTDETFTMDWWAATGGGGAATITNFPVAVPGMTQASQDIRVRVQAEGRTIRAKMWNAADAEPFGWHITECIEGALASTAPTQDAAGWIGIRSSLIGGNTNGPITISYDDLELFSPEFAGEVSSWPRSRDTSGGDRTVNITAADVTRRLGTGTSPLNSALRRYVLITPINNLLPVAYWPLEDGPNADADRVLSATGIGMLGFLPPTAGTSVGTVDWAAERSLPGGLQAPSLTGGASLVAFLNPPSNASQWMLSFCMKQSYSDGTYVQLTTQSGYLNFVLSRNPDTLNIDVSLSIDNGPLSTILIYSFPDKNDLEEWHQFCITAFQNGVDIDFFLEIDGAFADNFTETTETLEGLLRVQMSSVTDASQDTSFAHVMIFDAPFSVDVAGLYDAAIGSTGERALSRALRLCEEEQVEFHWTGSGIFATTPNTEKMGPQKAKKFLDLIQECATLDNGLLYSKRISGSFEFRTLGTMYARSSWATLSMSDGHFSPPWDPTPDDQGLRNDVTANRQDGGTARHELDDGSRYSVSSPSDGGAGRYDSTVTVNAERDSQLLAQAQWRVHLGTADEDRFPGIRLNLARDVFRDTAGLALSAKLRDLDVGDLVALTGMQSDDQYEDLSQLVVGYVKVFDQLTYDLTLTCRPGSRYATGIIDSGWQLDSDTTVTAEALDDTETGIDVTVTGTAWTATGMPYDLMVGGERVTATALSGAGPAQTFTVTRSVNGVVKSHSTGAQIRLADPNYLGK